MSTSLVSTLVLCAAAAVPVVAAYQHATVPAPPPEAPSTTWRAAVTAATGDAPTRMQHVVVRRNGIGLAVGNGRRLWRTTDGGRSWTPAKAPAALPNGVALRDNGVGLMVDNMGRIFRSTDAGLTWIESPRVKDQLAPEPRMGPVGRAVFGDGAVALAIGYRSVIRSVDDGRSWSKLDVPEQPYYEIALLGRTALVVGGSGLVLRSTDGGTTWSDRFLEVTNMLRGVAFADSLTAVAVGTDGLILRSEDAGVTWATVSSGTTLPLRAVVFADPRNGLITGFYGTVLRTRDAGRSWQAEESGTRAHLWSVAIAPGGTAVAVGWFDTILLRTPLADSTGGGR